MSLSCCLEIQRKIGAKRVNPSQPLYGFFTDSFDHIALAEAIKADHGFNVESRAIRDLLEILADFNSSARRDFLQFITGSPKLPIGGYTSFLPLIRSQLIVSFRVPGA